MAGRRFAALVAALAIVCGTLTLPAVRAQGAAPAWSVGDHWEYVGNGTLAGSPFSMESQDVVTERTTISVGTAAYHVFHVASTIDVSYPGASASFSLNGWFRVSDYALVKESENDMTTQESRTFDPPAQVFTFPLTDGETWSATTNETIMEPGRSPFTVKTTTNYTAHGPESLSVPAGTFRVFDLQASSGNVSASYFYSDTAGYYVRRVVRIEASGFPKGYVASLKSYGHAFDEVVWAVGIIIAVVVAVATVSAGIRWRRKAAVQRAQRPRPPQVFASLSEAARELARQPPSRPPGT